MIPSPDQICTYVKKPLKHNNCFHYKSFCYDIWQFTFNGQNLTIIQKSCETYIFIIKLSS